MSDVRKKVVPDKGRLNREIPVTKALEFLYCTGKNKKKKEQKIRTGTESTRNANCRVKLFRSTHCDMHTAK